MENWKDEPIDILWKGSLPLQEVKTKIMYKEILNYCTPTEYLNKAWRTNLENKYWKKALYFLWHNGIDAKKLILDGLFYCKMFLLK